MTIACQTLCKQFTLHPLVKHLASLHVQSLCCAIYISVWCPETPSSLLSPPTVLQTIFSEAIPTLAIPNFGVGYVVWGLITKMGIVRGEIVWGGNGQREIVWAGCVGRNTVQAWICHWPIIVDIYLEAQFEYVCFLYLESTWILKWCKRNCLCRNSLWM